MIMKLIVEFKFSKNVHRKYDLGDKKNGLVCF